MRMLVAGSPPECPANGTNCAKIYIKPTKGRFLQRCTTNAYDALTTGSRIAACADALLHSSHARTAAHALCSLVAFRSIVFVTFPVAECCASQFRVWEVLINLFAR
ncbi:hypothetical protein ACJJTC_018400 [Scirpophaga incertulas]